MGRSEDFVYRVMPTVTAPKPTVLRLQHKEQVIGMKQKPTTFVYSNGRRYFHRLLPSIEYTEGSEATAW